MFYKTAWLIGASGGIGLSLINLVAEFSDYVCLTDIIDLEKNHLAELGNNAKFWKTNLFDSEQVSRFADCATKEFGAPELLVIVAGYMDPKPLENTQITEIENIFGNNFKITNLAMRAFYKKCSHNPNVVKNIVVINSNAGLEPGPNQPVSVAMKRAIISLAQSQASSWKKLNIKINVIAPGAVAAGRNNNLLKMKFPDLPRNPNRPLDKIAFPQDLHDTCRFLINPRLLITGMVVVIDGGSSLV